MKPLMPQSTTVLVATWTCFGCAPSPEIGTSKIALGTSPADLHPSPLVAGEDALRRDLTELASDTYEGRNGGYEGERLAAAYIADRFQEIGLEPFGDGSSFLQKFEFLARHPESSGQMLESQNVVARLPASSEPKRDGVVVIGAHYDGQGRSGQADPGRDPSDLAASDDDIWNAANDNASSVAALLEIARLFKTGQFTNSRDIVFCAFGAEEHGMVGSFFFVNSKKVPAKVLVAMLNLEQLGERPGEDLMSAGFATSAAWPEVLAAADVRTGRDTMLALDLPHADTDYYPFYLQGVPTLTIGHPDGPATHTAADQVENMSFSDLDWRTEHIATVLEELVGLESRPAFEADISRELPLAAVSVLPLELAESDLPESSKALKIAAVLDSSALSYEIEIGDFIIDVDGQSIDDSYEYDLHSIVRERVGTDCVSLTVNRGDKQHEVCF